MSTPAPPSSSKVASTSIIFTKVQFKPNLKNQKFHKWKIIRKTVALYYTNIQQKKKKKNPPNLKPFLKQNCTNLFQLIKHWYCFPSWPHQMLGTENVNVIAIIPCVNLAIDINDWYMLNNLVMLPLLRIQTFLEFFRHAQKLQFFKASQMLDSRGYLF